MQGCPGWGPWPQLGRRFISAREGPQMGLSSYFTSIPNPWAPRAGVSFTPCFTFSLWPDTDSVPFLLPGTSLRFNLYLPLVPCPTPSSSLLPNPRCGSSTDCWADSHGSGWCQLPSRGRTIAPAASGPVKTQARSAWDRLSSRLSGSVNPGRVAQGWVPVGVPPGRLGAWLESDPMWASAVSWLGLGEVHGTLAHHKK